MTTKDNEEKDELVKWFYVGSGFGFAIGFGGVCGSLETCLFLVIGQHEALALCNSNSEHCKIAKEDSEAGITTRLVMMPKSSPVRCTILTLE